MTTPVAEKRGVKGKRLSPELEHRHDREIAAATYRREQARAGKGYAFKAPPLRKRAA